MADMTSTTMASWTPEVWSRKATVTYRSNTVLVPLLDHTWEPELGVFRGDIVNIPHFAQNDRSDVNARSTFGTGASVTFTADTESQTQLAVDKMGIYAWRQPVEAHLQALPQYENYLTNAAGQALGLYADYEIASDNTNGIDAATAIGTDGIDVTDDLVLEGQTVLNAQNAPNPDRVFVFSVETYESLLNIERYVNQLYNAALGGVQAEKGPGYMGHIYTLDFYMTNNLEAGSSGHKNGMFQKEWCAIASQKEVGIHTDINIADGLFREFAAWNAFGIKIVKSNFCREVDGK